jgi:myo-inositol 2-dehydrogenase / D-chiro-inositol 1-dehydrogenase
MPSQPLRIGLIGLGAIGAGAHLRAIRAHRDCELVAVADVSPAALAAAAALVPPCARQTSDPAELLGAADVDAIVLATPPWETHRLAAQALAKGLYVLAEKPLAPTAREARALRLVPGAEERLQVGFAYRHHPAIDRLRAVVGEGLLGTPLLYWNVVSDEASDPRGDPGHEERILETLRHGPPMIHDGAHVCDRLNLVFGSTCDVVSAWALRTEARFASANAVGAVLAYPGGSLARVETVWMLPRLPAPQLVAAGPRGRLEIDPPTFRLEVDTPEGVEVLDPPGPKQEVCFALQLERFVEACAAGRPVSPGLADALASLELTERIVAAAGEAA